MKADWWWAIWFAICGLAALAWLAALITACVLAICFFSRLP